MASPRRCAGHDRVHPDCLLDVVQHIDTLIPYWHIFCGKLLIDFYEIFDYDFQVSWGTSFLLSYLVRILFYVTLLYYTCISDMGCFCPVVRGDGM